VAPEHDRTVGDMLIALYRLPAYCADNFSGAEIRKPLAPEYDLVVRWVGQQFSPGWASEARSALANRPASLFIAAREDSLLGFCCYDATARGFVGPIGVQARARGQDVGAALLRAALPRYAPWATPARSPGSWGLASCLRGQLETAGSEVRPTAMSPTFASGEPPNGPESVDAFPVRT
jgi:GNAT superfamily N-acetyltransferase